MARNALDFLRASAKAISHDPKMAILCLATGIEVAIKTAIVSEHWTLIVKQSPRLDKFLQGDFISVNTEELYRIFDQVLGKPLPKRATDSFSKIFNHRNQIVHFYNKNISDSDRALRETISCSYHIDRFIKDNKELFPSAVIHELGRALADIRKHNEYLNEKFLDLKQKIDPLRSYPDRIIKCNYCQKDSCEVEHPDEPISDSFCHVCEQGDNVINIECLEDSCGLKVLFYVSNGYQTLQCEALHDITPQHIHDALDCRSSTSVIAASCAECGTMNLVAETPSLAICCECFEISDSTQTCEWCSERQLNSRSLEDSYWSGCAFCSGGEGWHQRD